MRKLCERESVKIVYDYYAIMRMTRCVIEGKHCG